jgi:hypothetical protein
MSLLNKFTRLSKVTKKDFQPYFQAFWNSLLKLDVFTDFKLRQNILTSNINTLKMSSCSLQGSREKNISYQKNIGYHI